MEHCNRRAFIGALGSAYATLGLAADPTPTGDLLVAQVASQTNLGSLINAKAMAVGLNAYFSAVNAAGGVAGRKIALLIKDDDLNAAKMVAATRDLIAQPQVLALVGFLNTGGLAELAKENIPGKAGIALIAPFQGNRNIVSADNFFPFRSGYADEVSALVKAAKESGKKRVAIYYSDTTFGPSMSQQAQTDAKNVGLNVVANVGVNVAPDKFDENMRAAVAEIDKATPDAIIMAAAGRFASEFVKLILETRSSTAQIYSMSTLPVDDIVKTVGGPKARGTIIAQALPFPFTPSLPLVAEYQRVMKAHAPDAALSYSSLEGFIGAKITTEALRRASPNPTREKILQALNNFGEWDLGGAFVNYSRNGRMGWNRVELTIVRADGKLIR